MSDRSTTANDGTVSAPSFRGRTVLLSLSGAAIAVMIVASVVVLRPRPDPGQLRQEAKDAVLAKRWSDVEAALKLLPAPEPDDWLLLAVAATNLNKNDAALDYLSRIPKDSPLGAQVALATARVELARFRARPCEDALLRALQLDPKLLEARRLLVYLYGSQGRRLELLAQFAALADEGALTFDLARHWCIAHQDRINDPADLQNALEQFVSNDSNDRWSRIALGNVYRQLGRFDKARDVLAPLDDSDPEARACRAEVEFDRGDLGAVARLLADGPRDHAKLARLRGRLALNRQDGAAAVTFFRLSETVDPNHFETIYGLAQALRQTGDRAAAEPYARRADAHRALRDLLGAPIDKDEPKSSLCMRTASICEAADYLPEARAWYRLAIALDPWDERAQHALYRLSASAEPSRARIDQIDETPR
jgi:tetratricopeptide (TPR) repeat protein